MRTPTPCNRRNHTVLLVEDDELLRSWLCAHLKREDRFTLLAVGSAEEALDVIKFAPAVDLVLSDFDLGGPLDGFDVASFARARFPVAPIILISGSAPDLPRIRKLLSLPRTTFLEKPFAPEVLDKRVQSALDS